MQLSRVPLSTKPLLAPLIKPAILSVLPLAAFPPPKATAPAPRRPYYVQRLETHAARFPGVSAPHAHDFYLLLYITQGSGTHIIYLQIYELRPGALFFLAPGQVHGWALNPDATGYIVFFEAEVYQRRYPAGCLHSYQFFDPSHLPPADITIAPLLGQLWQEASQPLAVDDSSRLPIPYTSSLILELAARYHPAAPGPAANRCRRSAGCSTSTFVRRKRWRFTPIACA